MVLSVMVVCICIIIFHGIYSPYPQIFFLWEANFFFKSCSLGVGILHISWGPSVLGGPNFLFGAGVLGHFLP